MAPARGVGVGVGTVAASSSSAAAGAQGCVWQHRASTACQRFNGAAPNQEGRDQRGEARLWPTYQQNCAAFFAPLPTKKLHAPKGASICAPRSGRKF